MFDCEEEPEIVDWLSGKRAKEVLAEIGEALGFETYTFENSTTDVEWKGKLENFCKVNFRFFLEKEIPEIKDECEFHTRDFKPVIIEEEDVIEQKKKEIADLKMRKEPIFLEKEKIINAWKYFEKFRNKMEDALDMNSRSSKS